MTTSVSWPRHWRTVLKFDAVSVEDHFFDDLGANSLAYGPFLCARAQEKGMGDGVDAGHLSLSHGRPSRKASGHGGGGDDSHQRAVLTHRASNIAY